MAKVKSILIQIMFGISNNNIRFQDVCTLLKYLGFTERVNGSHHIFTFPGVIEIINIQPLNSGNAKPYQIKQIRKLLTNYKLYGDLLKDEV